WGREWSCIRCWCYSAFSPVRKWPAWRGVSSQFLYWHWGAVSLSTFARDWSRDTLPWSDETLAASLAGLVCRRARDQHEFRRSDDRRREGPLRIANAFVRGGACKGSGPDLAGSCALRGSEAYLTSMP